ncbi:geranylgeranyl reductase [Methanoregula boonei 6A8]|uniref:Geranylgeranyl reductase n=1 Tax=Methanoregula boonei (strain DSM 21154 / JCM 14090 / 6A8) TaxID=456442 RepID=A7I7H3_METB6|nr:NAD(P)/FAD-dependent oxidoreductase [Methanoregula boonei]ABS55684.1 geranylgeranyl reductase [Methanoregula boonei 6A8]
MSRPAYDVVVAGAGPAGSAAARACAEQGLSVLCVEEQGTIGYPVQCAGLLSRAAFEECAVSRRSIQNTVTGARIVPSSGQPLTINAGVPKAYVVDRALLDREMAQAAADAGAEFRPKTAVCGIQDGKAITRGANGHEEIPFRILIAADGPRGTIARSLGFARPPVFLAGIQAEGVLHKEIDLVELYPDASPEFFGWVIPNGNGRARAGLCGKVQVKERFAAFLKRTGLQSDLHLVTGTIPLGVMPRTYGQRTLFVGDAAGFAKPTSGGGVYTGVRSARHAAAVAAACCEQDCFSDSALAEYERRWQEDIGRELSMGYRLFQMRQHLPAETIDQMIHAMSDPAIVQEILRYGDMDRPAKIAGILVRHPSLFRFFSPLLLSGIRSFF